MIRRFRRKVARKLSPLTPPVVLDVGEVLSDKLMPPEAVSIPITHPALLDRGPGAVVLPRLMPREAVSIPMLSPASLDGRAGEVVLERLMRPERISIPIPPISFRLSIANSPGKAAALLPFKPLEQAFEDLLIVDGLDKLRRPQIFGRAYTEASPHPATGLTGPHITGRCQHGLRRRDCSLCGSAAPPRRRQPGFHGDIDVFHLLRLVLQPPILDRLAQPGLFPDGRRPYPFQVNGIQWLLDHPEGLLADEMGLGKTMQAIVAMRILFRRGDMRQVLVVAPASVGVTWEREISTWAPELSVVRVKGNP